MRTRILVQIIVPTITGVLLSTSGVVHAHFTLMSPPAAETDMGGGKGVPPCGPLTPASNIVTKAQGGHPLMVSVMETVAHPGFYRIALSVNSRTELPLDNVVYDSTGKILPPSGMPSGTSAKADFETTPVFPVLADNVWPHQAMGPQMFTTMVTLPNITCAKCTLQVIEFMNMHGPNQSAGGGPGGGYFYHHCADLQITADPALPDAGTTDARADVGSTGTDGGTAGDSGNDGAGSTGGVSGTGGGVVATGGSGIVASTGGASATGGSGTGGSLATGGVTGTGGTVTGTGTGGQVGSGGGTAAPVSGGGKSGGCVLASEGIGNAGGSLAVAFIGLMLITRRRRRA